LTIYSPSFSSAIEAFINGWDGVILLILKSGSVCDLIVTVTVLSVPLSKKIEPKLMFTGLIFISSIICPEMVSL
jgi:hypothetical protein